MKPKRILIGTRRVAADADGKPGEWSSWEFNWIAHNEGDARTEEPQFVKHARKGQSYWEQIGYRWFVAEPMQMEIDVVVARAS